MAKQSQDNVDQPFEGLEPPNHTQVPNTLFDDLMRQMKEAELRVTLAICRHTFGWHKKEDEISLTRLQGMTGLSRQGVIQGIEAGIRRGVIRRRPKGQSFVYRLRLVNVVDQLGGTDTSGSTETPQVVNVVDQLEGTTSQQSRPVEGPASQLRRPELVNYVDTQKKERNGGGGDRARAEKILLEAELFPATVKQILALEIDPPTLIASVHYLKAEGWGPGAIADRLRLTPPEKGHPYERPATNGRAGGDIPPDRPHGSTVATRRGSYTPTGGAELRDPGWQDRLIADAEARAKAEL